MEKHPLHLKIPDLQTSEDVTDAVDKRERLNKAENQNLDNDEAVATKLPENIPNNPNERIEVYMDRLEKIFLNPDKHTRERNLEMLRPAICDAFIIKPERVPKSFFELQENVARERGQAVENIPQEMRDRMIATIIEDQKASLDSWIDYLTSEDAVYPTWFKYFVFRNIVKLSQFDKEIGKFKNRTDTTTALFPDIYREPLAQICDIYEKVEKDNKVLKDPKVQELFSKKFPTLYAELIQKTLSVQVEKKEGVKGQWVKYNQDNPQDAEKLYKSIESKGTGWCTAGFSTAKTQIESGDFYVYYTDVNGEPTQPRIAIRMNGDKRIGEIRGILPHQSLEPQMAPILDEKLKDFGSEVDKYQKKSADMKRLTSIEHMSKIGQSLSKEDLIFLYEIDSNIEGFGYVKDPRIEEIRSTRNPKKDAPIVLGCIPSEIAWKQEDIGENTKSYIGPLFPGIFQINLEHIYTSFPESKLHKYQIEIGGRNKDELKRELAEKKVYVSDWANQLLGSKDFTVLPNTETMDLLRLTIKDLGLSSGATTDEIYRKTSEYGLELCPAEVGPRLRLSYLGADWMLIAMKQIADRYGAPSVFRLRRDGGEFGLGALDAEPSRGWGGDSRFLFSLRKRKLVTQ
ncbi:MAG: hypothetical protein AAB777_03250 [Patescibacteria group bacterium]